MSNTDDADRISQQMHALRRVMEIVVTEPDLATRERQLAVVARALASILDAAAAAPAPPSLQLVPPLEPRADPEPPPAAAAAVIRPTACGASARPPARTLALASWPAG